MAESFIHKIRFDEKGLIPAVIQDASSNEIVSFLHLDNPRLINTLQTGKAEFLNSSGEGTSFLASYQLLDLKLNRDGTSLTILVERISEEPIGKTPVSLLRDLGDANLPSNSELSLVNVDSMELGISLQSLYTLIEDRKEKRPEGSYTTYLFNSGLDKILKKVAEESGEVIIAAKNRSEREIVSELSDLFYHLLVLMVEREVKLSDINDELRRRAARGAPVADVE